MSWLLWILLALPASFAEDAPGALAAEAPASEGATDARADAEPDRADWAPAQWIAEVDARAERMPSLRYSARRSTDRGDTTVEERWRFLLDGDRFRIDYFGDTARQVTCDGQVLIDYVPAKGRALKIDLNALGGNEAEDVVRRVLEKVSVPGFRIGHAQGVRWSFAEPGSSWDRPVVVLEGEGEDDATLRYVIDRERVAVLRTTIEREGQTLLLTDSHDHREIHPGVWFPHEVRMRAPAEGGDVRVAMHLTKVGVLEDPSPDLFQMKLDPSIPIEEMP